MPSGFFTAESWMLPTVDEVKVDNLQYITTFTANPTTDVITTAINHTQIPSEIVMVMSSGALPAPLQPFTLYRVRTPNLGPTTMELAENAGWNPPPENPKINITDAGTGTHTLWIRPLEGVATVGVNPTNFLTSEVTGNTRGGVYLNPSHGTRFQVAGISGIAGLLPNTDYFSDVYQQTPTCRWSIIGTPVSGGGSCGFYTYAIPAVMEWGLGDLGALFSESEDYYSICGDCAFGGGGGGGAATGKMRHVEVQKPPRIYFQEQDITELVGRARSASSTIENLKIVGTGVSGNPKDGFMINQ
jgi:hypothetical protein